MIAVIFQVEMNVGREEEYFALAAELRKELEEIDGFVSVERFESLTQRGRYVSLSFWRDEQAVLAWRSQSAHRTAQLRGKAGIFSDLRISVAHVIRDYRLADRLPSSDHETPGR